MNKNRRGILLASGIISLVVAVLFLILAICAGSITQLLIDLMEAAAGGADYSLYMESMKACVIAGSVIALVLNGLAGTFTIIAASDPAKFEARRKLYITGAVFTLVSSLISVSAILYYVNFGLYGGTATTKNA